MILHGSFLLKFHDVRQDVIRRQIISPVATVTVWVCAMRDGGVGVRAATPSLKCCAVRLGSAVFHTDLKTPVARRTTRKLISGIWSWAGICAVVRVVAPMVVPAVVLAQPRPCAYACWPRSFAGQKAACVGPHDKLSAQIRRAV